MNVLDIGIILILIMCFIVGFKKGAIKEGISLVGIVLVFIISFYLMKPIGNFLCINLPFLNFSGSIEKIQALNIIIYQFIAFILIFSLFTGLYAFLIKVSGILEKLVDLTIILLLPSKIIGGIISFVVGYLIIFILLLMPFNRGTLYESSKITPFILDKTPVLAKQTKNIKTCIDEVYNLDNKLDTDEANQYTVELLLKYKIVDKETVEKLINKKKLTNINIGR